MADSNYQPKVYRRQGGDALVIASGGSLEFEQATVTQQTNATTAVTANGVGGVITTVAQNIAAAGEVQFTVNNSQVAAGDVVVACIASGSVGGTTIVSVTAVTAGSFQLTLTNLHAATAETGTLVINFVVLKAKV